MEQFCLKGNIRSAEDAAWVQKKITEALASLSPSIQVTNLNVTSKTGGTYTSETYGCHGD
jgi:hypothetical protein